MTSSKCRRNSPNSIKDECAAMAHNMYDRLEMTETKNIALIMPLTFDLRILKYATVERHRMKTTPNEDTATFAMEWSVRFMYVQSVASMATNKPD